MREKELQNAFLQLANLQGADLSHAKLQGAVLSGANLQGAHLWHANLQGAFLSDANLQEAVLLFANLQGADLSYANLEGANLIGVRADAETRFDWANLTYANLYHSYLDETKTIRNAIVSEKEINEIVADFLKKKGIKIWQFLLFRRLEEIIPKLWQSFLKRGWSGLFP